MHIFFSNQQLNEKKVKLPNQVYNDNPRNKAGTDKHLGGKYSTNNAPHAAATLF